jgi:hypothetical protein
VSASIGLELDPRVIRGVRIEGWHPRPTRTLEAEWTADGIEEVVRGLREHLGRARRVAVAVRLPLLFAKRVRLPPLPPAERRRILRLEPQRFFPVRLEELVIGLGQGDLAFAVREDKIAEWTAALEVLGPVDLVEPGPVALARALGRAGVTDAIAVLDDAGSGVGVIEIRNGEVTGTRRLYGPLASAAAALESAVGSSPHPVYLAPWSEDRARALAPSGASPEPMPDSPAVPAPFLTAYGAALGIGGGLDDALLTDELGARIRGRRRRELVFAALACTAALVLALVSADAWRARTVRQLAAEVRDLQAKAVPALALRNEIGILSRQTRAVAELESERPDPLRVLLALLGRLPPGAYLQALRLTGTGWQIDGYAPQAASVIEALGGAPEFHEVRFISATNRSQFGDRTYESFSVAFRFVPAS